MSSSLKALRTFLDAPMVALVEVAKAKGSTPREKGAWMLVSADAIYGTIGGGQLEFMAIDQAREMLGFLPSPLWGGWPAGPGGGGQASGMDEGRRPSSPPPPRSASRIDPPHKGGG